MIKFLINIGLRIVSILLTVLFFWIIISTFTFIENLTSNKTSKEKEVKKEIKKEVQKLVSHYHNWNDNKSRSYSGKVSVKVNDVKKSTLYKNNINPISWSDFYKKIIENDKLKISTIYELFDEIYRSNSLNRKDFADIIVTFVQNIPYNILTMDSCNEAYLKNQSIKDMIDEGIECDGNVFLGLYTPTEFISNFKGDCDTKILNSDVYGHSILGINLPSRGRYKTHLGKRYYTWETTSLNWQLGDLSPSTSRMSNWNVAL